MGGGIILINIITSFLLLLRNEYAALVNVDTSTMC